MGSEEGAGKSGQRGVRWEEPPAKNVRIGMAKNIRRGMAKYGEEWPSQSGQLKTCRSKCAFRTVQNYRLKPRYQNPCPNTFPPCRPDDVGNYPAYLAIFFDRPAVLRFLHDKGVDLSRKCDDSNYGTPAFYCMHLGKTNMLSDMWKMGYDLTDPCDKYGMPPSYYAEKKKDAIMIEHLKEVTSRGTLQDVMATIVQRCTRGLFARNIYSGLCEDRTRRIVAQTMIGAVWRGGVVRMRDNKRRREEEERKKNEPAPAPEPEPIAAGEEKEAKEEKEEKGEEEKAGVPPAADEAEKAAPPAEEKAAEEEEAGAAT